VERQGGKAEGAALRTLVELAGEDQWRLSEEINKLVNFAPEVTEQSVRELVVPSVERSIFDLVEAMTAGRTEVAIGVFAALLRQRESEMYVLTMIQWQLRNLLLAKTAPAAMSPAELAKEAGLSPYVAGKMAVAQQALSEAALVQAYREAADCEFDIKTGRLKAEAAVEQLIYRVARAAQ
jgi:DNA polymerase-3 subunit delta